MLFVVFSLIIGLIFGVLAGGIVLLNKRKFTPAVGIIAAAGLVGGFLISLTLFWFGIPVLGSIILICLLLGGILVLVLSRLYHRSFARVGRNAQGIISLAIAGLMLFGSAYFGLSTIIWKGYDTAKYFDSILMFPDEKMPFNHIITGDNVRVVDSDLAAEIIQKSQPFGSNSMILELHVGKLYGKLMWIGVMGTDAIQIGTDNAGRKRNSIFGFVGVDLTDPSQAVIVVEQPFKIGSYLVRQKQLERIVWKINPNYRVGDNSYFSMNDEGEMRLLAPYSISTSLTVESGLGLTTFLEKVGGVLEFNAQGTLIKDYRDLSELPDYARIQCYPESWLEYNINKWGRHRKGNHEFAYWFTTTEQLGISYYDDVRVIYDANTQETSQYVMLTQPESESQLLRGAIKANASGIYFFDWADLDPKPIDTQNALYHSRTAIDVEVGTTEHNYRPILPLLFPIQMHYKNMTDYAYVVPIQFGSIRFGGICITNPFDPSGVDTIVELAEATDTVDEVLTRAIDEYLTFMGITQPVEDNYTETLEIAQLASFEQDGNTIILAQGNLTYIPEGNTTAISRNETVWFTQQFLNVTQWEIALFLQVGDTLELNIIIINEIIYCQEIISVN
ncbi:hypothetical protein DRO91_00540 [Candidatus Heimdallarchaeota archaeon]|nr:MAG: hypothetical protein DRP02_00980 [Candidatus Gerdarchaeota archaeon]RLI74416.1 MAG: hypothetical protein DRO91_00540 [Candidatus Heimdallarchaeota archaeon]